MAVLDRSELAAIYEDMQARLDMGLLSDDNGDLDGNAFGENLREAILEKMPTEKSDKHRKVDIFSVAFGAISERILRAHYDKQGMGWW